MQLSQLFHCLYDNALGFVHKKRLASLLAAAQSLVKGGRLTVTGLGRAMDGSTKVKHKIKRVDRLLSNEKLYGQRASLYHAITSRFIKANSRPVILIDWSPFKHKRDYGLLRASIGEKGRAIVVYQQVYTYANVMRIKPQQQFLMSLQSVLPKGCRPILITDMGFNSPWFRAVMRLNWDFIGRIRRDIKHKTPTGWVAVGQLKTTASPQHQGKVELFSEKPLEANLITYKKSKLGQKVLSSNPTIKQYQKQACLPWILATSLPDTAKAICRWYKQRMLIETSFRDVKSYRLGMGLNLSWQYSDSLIRRELLLLIAHLAHCLLLVVGKLAEMNRWQNDFQANSVKTHRVLSLVFLGKQVIEHHVFKLKASDISKTLKGFIYDNDYSYTRA